MNPTMRLGTALLLILAWAGTGSAGEILYARSDGAFMARDNPAMYTALNVLDGDKTTVWCSAGTGQNAEIEIVFSERTIIDRVDIATGNQIGSDDFKAFGRVKEVQISAGDERHKVRLADRQGLQTTEFDPAVNHERLVLRMTGGYRGKSQRHVCISDVIFYQNKKPLQAKDMGRQIRSHADALPYMDTWVAGPEDMREKELIFGVSGTYRFVWVPSDPDLPTVRILGPWRLGAAGPEVKLDKKDKEWIPVKVKRDDAERVTRLKLETGQLQGVYDRRRENSHDW